MNYKLYCIKPGLKLSELYKGSLWDCKRELFGYLCKDAGCLGKVHTWQMLKDYCERRDIPLSFSPERDEASYDTWNYVILKCKQ